MWPSGKALGLVSGRASARFRFGSPFSSKIKGGRGGRRAAAGGAGAGVGSSTDE